MVRPSLCAVSTYKLRDMSLAVIGSYYSTSAIYRVTSVPTYFACLLTYVPTSSWVVTPVDRLSSYSAIRCTYDSAGRDHYLEL